MGSLRWGLWDAMGNSFQLIATATQGESPSLGSCPRPPWSLGYFGYSIRCPISASSGANECCFFQGTWGNGS
jgi:hypothetical protein